MYDNILIALDGSEGSARAVPHAVELARRDGAKLVVVHVEERIAAKGDMPPLRADEEEIVKTIRDQVAAIQSDGIDAELVTTSVMLGGPGSAIAAVAEDVGADLIVIGTRGHSSIPGLIVGSVAHRLLHVAHRPILAVPPSVADDR